MKEPLIQEMLVDACFRAGSENEFSCDLRAYLESQRVPEEDIEAMLAGPPRLGIYRRLVRNNLEGVTRKLLARTRARFETAFDASFDAFVEEVGPRTHYLRDVPSEFLAWVAPRWAASPAIPPYASELAAHELVEFAVGIAPRPREIEALGEITVERALIFADALRLVRYTYAVHTLPSEIDDRTVPAKSPVALLVYRDEADAVRFLELTALAASITERLLEGTPLATALGPACVAEKIALDDAVLADVARLLADFGERGILLGARL
jgi:hypothetical protein